MPYLVRKEVVFDAAHRLPNHDGKCRRLHGHTFRAEIAVARPELHASGPKEGMAVDFGDLKAAIGPLVEDKLDHHYLNDTLPIDVPTSEAIARWLFVQLDDQLDGLYEVTVSETCTSSATYRDPEATDAIEHD